VVVVLAAVAVGLVDVGNTLGQGRVRHRWDDTCGR
jgi:hypothetical protein